MACGPLGLQVNNCTWTWRSEQVCAPTTGFAFSHACDGMLNNPPMTLCINTHADAADGIGAELCSSGART